MAFSNGGCKRITKLVLEDNEIGDAGCVALAAALGEGAMPNCEVLDPELNGIGDAGCEALAAALVKEPCWTHSPGRPQWRGTEKALSVCNQLCLDDNDIGDVGHEALATETLVGALSECEHILLRFNKASRIGRNTVRVAAKRRDIDVICSAEAPTTRNAASVFVSEMLRRR